MRVDAVVLTLAYLGLIFAAHMSALGDASFCEPFKHSHTACELLLPYFPFRTSGLVVGMGICLGICFAANTCN